MKLADKVNLAGILLTAAGSSLGMFGIILQTNGYYAFKWLQLLRHIFLVAKDFCGKGPVAAWNNIQTTAGLADKKGENRGKSLLGLYLVLFGFTLQLVGSVLLAIGIFAI
jgi:hypothetical protein